MGRPVAAAIVEASAPDCTAPLKNASAAAVAAGAALDSVNWTVRRLNVVSARARAPLPPLLLPVSSYTARIVTVTPGVDPATAATNAARAAASNDAPVRPVSETTTAAAVAPPGVVAVTADSGAGPHSSVGGAHVPAAAAAAHVPSGARHPPCVPFTHASHALHSSVPAAQAPEPSTWPLQTPVTGSWHVPAPPAAHPPHAAGTPLAVSVVTGPAPDDAPSHELEPSGHPPQGSAGQHTPSPECTHGPALPSAQSQPVGDVVGVAVAVGDGVAVAVGDGVGVAAAVAFAAWHTGAAAAPAQMQPDVHATHGAVLVQ